MASIKEFESQNERHAILLVEDEPVLREILKEGLEEHGYEVYDASGGEEAILWLGAQKRIDLLLTDVRMPRMSGPELYNSVKWLRPKLQVLFMSGFADYEVLIRAVAEGSVAFVQKPFTLDMLCARVDAILSRQSTTTARKN